MTVPAPAFQEPPAPPAAPAPAHTNAAQAPTGHEPAEVGPNGFPLSTPVAEMSAEHAANYWKHQARRHEADKKTAQQQVNDLKPRAEQFAALEQASKTEAERAVEQARREARETAIAETEATARSRYGSVLVGAEFRVHLAGKLTPEQIGTLVEGLDVSRFMDDDGQPDTERIGAYVAAIPTAAAGAPVAPSGPHVTASQGNRPPVKASGLGEGASLYADRHAKRAPSAT